ncbi:hypothetical protein [Halorussus salinisoli]|nr:hypothetical protein [Halorussus salinisoli]
MSDHEFENLLRPRVRESPQTTGRAAFALGRICGAVTAERERTR